VGRDAPPYPVRRQSPLDVLVLRSAFRVACPRHRWLALGGLKPLQFPPGPSVVVGALGIAERTPPPDFLPRLRAHFITSSGQDARPDFTRLEYQLQSECRARHMRLQRPRHARRLHLRIAPPRAEDAVGKEEVPGSSERATRFENLPRFWTHFHVRERTSLRACGTAGGR